MVVHTVVLMAVRVVRIRQCTAVFTIRLITIIMAAAGVAVAVTSGPVLLAG